MSDLMMNSEDFNMILGGIDPNGLLVATEEEIIPEAYDTIPSNENFSGPYDFDVLIPPSKSLVYSPKLQKLFIKMANDFTVLFTWNYQMPAHQLFVRAKPRFSNHEDASKPVKRCLQHSHEDDFSNKDSNGPIRHHILRCKNTQALYEGGSHQHLNVCVPLSLPQTGTDSVPHTYQFVCQNSCATGMNRKPIEVIFTLEDESGQIHGRKSINVRICSCPKRDKEKEEAEFDNNPTGQPMPGKRRKGIKREYTETIVQDVHADELQNITITVVGNRGKKAALESVYNSVAGQMTLYPGNEHLYKPILEDLKNRIYHC